MSYKPICKDLIYPKKNCYFCSRELSYKAYILEDMQTGAIVYAGPTCMENHIDSKYKKNNIPDFTKNTIVQETEENDNTKEIATTESSKTVSELNSEYRNAIEYLELRANKLKDFNHVSYKILDDYYQKYIKEGLTSKEINHIINIEKKVNALLKLKNLQKCYNYQFWIDIAIEKQDNNTFLKSIKNHLLINKSITKEQKVGVNKWLKNLANIPQLK